MKKIKIFTLLLTVAFTFTNCDDESGRTAIIAEIIPPVSQKYNELKANALNGFIQTYITEVNDTGELNFISNNGIQVIIYGSCLTFGGEPVTGEVEIRFVELFGKGNLLSTGIASMGKHTDGSLEMLIPGGTFHLSLFQNGQPLDEDSFCGYTMQIPTLLTEEADYDMTLRYGSFNENENIIWEEINEGEIEITDDVYYVYVSQFGWTNISRFYDDARPDTSLFVTVPDGYNIGNSSVYLTYNGENGLARLDYNTENGLFIEHYGKIPVGLEGSLIFVSEHNGQWVYVTKEIVVEENQEIEILHSELKITTLSTLINLVNALP